MDEVQKAVRISLDGRSVTIGRDSSCDIVLRGAGVSRRHARIFCSPDMPAVTDLGSTFGVRINGEIVREGVLAPGNRLTIGVHTFAAEIDSGGLVLKRMAAADGNVYAPVGDLQRKEIRIGRDPSNSVCLDHPLVSRFHALVRPDERGGHRLYDCGSTNGTYVNGRRVRRAALGDGEILQIGPYRFVLERDRLLQATDRTRIRLEALDIAVETGKKAILRDISLTVNPGEFVAVLGPSGAGKTTLAYALSGRLALTRGDIFINGFPLRQYYPAFRSSIGLVTQENMVRDELTVLETFGEQSVLRLPRDSVPSERRERIRELLGFLELDSAGGSLIGKLSGGEAKRVHMGVELLASPGLIFLDEPLAGLDPGLIRRFMRLFRKIADKGHTLLLTTHILEQLDLCDRVVFLNRGEMLFDSPPKEIGKTFGVGSLAELYERVRTDEILVSRMRAVQRNLRRRRAGSDQEGDGGKPEEGRRRLSKPGSVPRIRQMAVLVARYARMLVRDAKNSALILSQSPLIAALLACVYGPDTRNLPLSFYFCLSISAIWIGGINSVREISREWLLVRRELFQGLSLSAYLVSKLGIFAALSLIQSAIFVGFLVLFFRHFEASAPVGAVVAAGCVAGSVMGLFISAAAGSVNKSISLLPVFFIPQIFFSGILIPFDIMPAAGRVLSHLTISRPVFSMLKRSALLGLPIRQSAEWRTLFFLCSLLIILMYGIIRIRCQRRLHVE
jgi:ABC-type multidrug transport system ATPase subunit/pSer/pThr/pTyr-binding forkhead associated (FHA) protein